MMEDGRTADFGDGREGAAGALALCRRVLRAATRRQLWLALGSGWKGGGRIAQVDATGGRRAVYGRRWCGRWPIGDCGGRVECIGRAAAGWAGLESGRAASGDGRAGLGAMCASGGRKVDGSSVNLGKIGAGSTGRRDLRHQFCRAAREVRESTDYGRVSAFGGVAQRRQDHLL